jgi:hypothetical protein
MTPIKLNGDNLPCVGELKHLGNLLESDNSMGRNIAIKRGQLIGEANSLSQEFFFVKPGICMQVLNTFCESFYGSELWDLFSPDGERLYAAWNVVCLSYTTTKSIS